MFSLLSKRDASFLISFMYFVQMHTKIDTPVHTHQTGNDLFMNFILYYSKYYY